MLSEIDFACPICLERLKDPFVTQCGHSFCYSCITTHLQNKSVCPCCSDYLTQDKVFPNYLLNKVAFPTLSLLCQCQEYKLHCHLLAHTVFWPMPLVRLASDWTLREVSQAKGNCDFHVHTAVAVCFHCLQRGSAKLSVRSRVFSWFN